MHLALVHTVMLSIAITSLGEERGNLSAFRTFVRFALVWFCLFHLPLGVWEGLGFMIVALPGLFSYPFYTMSNVSTRANRIRDGCFAFISNSGKVICTKTLGLLVPHL